MRPVSPSTRRRLARGLLLGLLAVAGTAHAQASPPLDQFLCLRAVPSRHADRALRFSVQKQVAVRDRLSAGALKIDVKKPVALCLPADAPDGTLHDAVTHLESYAARLSRTRPTQPKPPAEDQHVTNRFGSEDFELKALNGMLVPSAVAFDPPPGALASLGAVDHFTCYGSDRADGLRSRPASEVPLALESGIGTLLVDVRAPVQLCLPADADGGAPAASAHPEALACYTAKLTRTKPPQASPFPRDAATTNHFGSEQLTVSATLALCVPSEVHPAGASPTPVRTPGPTPTPTVTPPPDFTLRVNPAEQTVTIGESAHFTATAVFKNGDTEDFTERVLWSSSTDAGTAPNVPGDRGRIDAVDGGTTAISVLDEATGVTSTATGEDAVLTVTATLERIELLPISATRGKGESIRLRATGHFAGGFTRDIAARLTYGSSKPSVANATNDPVTANHSRIVAVGEGTATISAVDPASLVTSTQSNDDVALTVLPPLERCEIVRENFNSVKLELGGFRQFTAHGFYAGGFSRVVTQQVEWKSTAPDVAAVPNQDGDRSRVLAVGPGEAQISATDSVTGVACANPVPVVVGEPDGIYLRYEASEWPPGRPIRVPKTRHVVAVQAFTPSYFVKNVTEKLVFETSDPSILAAPNIPGDRGRLVGVGSGTATVTAKDPTTGATSQALSFRVLDGLTRVMASDHGTTHTLAVVGQLIGLQPTGLFADGLAALDFEDVTVVSSNPAAVQQSPYGGMVAIALGVATISVIDNATGISSDAFGQSLRVGVRGPLESISLIPEHIVRRVGERAVFGAVAHYVGGATELITNRMTYSSTDLAVAAPGNDGSLPGLVNPTGAGTVVIDATDSVTGISSADSGGGATIDVVGPLQRLIVQPSPVTRSLGRSFSFTAIGRDAVGREINLTQDVVWSSSNGSVATATNDVQNRSRVDVHGQGTTTISAFDPLENISSTTTGDDATLVGQGVLLTLKLAAEHTQLVVGDVIQLTATGTLDVGGPVNLTQDVEYTSSNPAVAAAENPPGDRSRILALAPGTATISAHDPGTGVATAAGGTVTLTVVAP